MPRAKKPERPRDLETEGEEPNGHDARTPKVSSLPDNAMACQRPLLLLLCLMITFSTHLSKAQHWSHGWYPGGKREVDLAQSPEVSEDIKLCDGEGCAYLKIPREKIVTSLLADWLAKNRLKKK